MGSKWNPATIAKRANMTLDEILSKSMIHDEELDEDTYADDDDLEDLDDFECEEEDTEDQE